MATSKPSDAAPEPEGPPAGGSEGTEPAEDVGQEQAAPAETKKGRKAAKKEEPTQPARRPTDAMPGLIEGRMVHYVLPLGKRQGEHRAAVVSYVHNHIDGLVNLHVLLNGTMDYDGHNYPGHTLLAERVPFSEAPKEGAWHWMERA